ncbi:MAG TPA: protoporphyrinogen oxidase [Nitrospiria bacterium]|jgi:oxygen-dependent protoporphyrinogen oxidase|nr:protoporphyrinogen oxidase [Nitrospiria bacterium]
MKTVAIVGGGITGLAAAYYLEEQAKTGVLPLTSRLIERLPQCGGKIRTDRMNGFIIEGGPDSFISMKPWGIELCQRLGLSEHLTGTNPNQKQIYLLRKGRLAELPEGIMALMPTRLWPFLKSPLISPLGKLRMGLDLFIPPKADKQDESLASFVQRRLGKEALERIAEPLLAGIYAGDPKQMSLASTFPQFREIEQKHGSLTRGMLARRRAVTPVSSRYTMFMTLKEGMGELVETLTKRLDPSARITGSGAIGIQRRSTAYELLLADGRRLEADAVILATPAFVTAGLLKQIDPLLSDRLIKIPYVSTATVSLAYKRSGFSHPLNGFGFVVPRSEKRKILACTWTSTKFPHRADSDHVLVRCFVGGAGREELALQDEGSLIKMVCEDLKAIMGISAEPVLTKVYRWEKANPQYNIGHLERVAEIEKMTAQHPGLFVTGAAYRGVGVADCIHQGLQTAEKVLAHLRFTKHV